MERRDVMNIDKLQTFKTLCETMSFTKTAEELYTSQPNVTKQIKSLEEELGYPLIVRTHKSFTLTEYGKLFYETAKKVVATMNGGLNALRELADTTSRSIIIGATPFIGSTILPALLPLLNDAFPDHQVSIKVDRSKVENPAGVFLGIYSSGYEAICEYDGLRGFFDCHL